MDDGPAAEPFFLIAQPDVEHLPLVLASAPYDEEDYYRDYQDFLTSSHATPEGVDSPCSSWTGSYRIDPPSPLSGPVMPAAVGEPKPLSSKRPGGAA